MRRTPHDPLVLAAGAFLAANLLHTADHFRQGTERLTTEIVVGGTAVTLLAVVVLALAAHGHRDAPLLCAVAGAASAAGIVASHLLPHWSALSDPYPALHPGGLSWAAVLLEIATALTLALAGARIHAATRSTGRFGSAA
jgi:hypothetical protein